MPLYEYQCDSCGRRFERIQKFSDPPVTICPTCGEPVQKLFSSPAIQFKGSGFYITDYARSGKPSEGEGAGKSGSSSKSEGDSAAKGEKSEKSEKSETSSASSKTESASSDSSSSSGASKDAPAKPAGGTKSEKSD